MAGVINAGASPRRRPFLASQRLGGASDERLTQEMRNGSEAAFEVVYGRHSRGLLALCRHLLGSREEAEEALQHSFAAAWADLQRRDRPAPESLKPWLYAIARHRCLSILRSRGSETVPLEETPSKHALIDEVGLRADMRALLEDLRDLPEEQKTALILSELGGLSHADIADVLGRRESGIKALVFQARTTLGDWREAREATCMEIREQLSVLRGGALRRRLLRRHLLGCASCRAFRAEMRAQRRRLAVVLPVMPSFGLKRAVFAAFGLGGAGAGATAGGVALTLPAAATAVALVSLGSLGAAPAKEPGPASARAATAANRAQESSRPESRVLRSVTLVPTQRFGPPSKRPRGRISRAKVGRAAAVASRARGHARETAAASEPAVAEVREDPKRGWKARRAAPQASAATAVSGRAGRRPKPAKRSRKRKVSNPRIAGHRRSPSRARRKRARDGSPQLPRRVRRSEAAG